MLPKSFFIISILISSFIFTTHSSYIQCLPHQKSLLLQLKNELDFDSSTSTKLVQWNARDDECCKWYGVDCDAAGHIVSLQLDREGIYGGIVNSSSLFRLVYLQKLNLAYNFLYHSTNPIPRRIHILTYLTHLNLSNAGFGGQVPTEISSLKRLVSLDITNDYTTLQVVNLEMLLQNLTCLRELYLDNVSITSSAETRKWSHIISSYLPNLTTLSLCYCNLSGPLVKSFWKLHSLSILQLDGNDLSTTVPDMFASFSSLTTLSLARCNFNGIFPNMIFEIPSLHNLDLSGNKQLSGSIPPFTQTRNLKSLVLSDTNLSDLIPSSISNLKTLSHIDLSNCKFTGLIPSTFANLTELIYVNLNNNYFTGSLSSALFEGLSNLVHLDLGNNLFTSSFPNSLFGLPSLRELDLSNNKFSGLVGEFSTNVSNIVWLDLSHNELEGPIPDSIFQLQSLQGLMLSENLFNGTFQLDKIQSLTSLVILGLSNNNLSVDLGDANSSKKGLTRLHDERFLFYNFICKFELKLDIIYTSVHIL